MATGGEQNGTGIGDNPSNLIQLGATGNANNLNQLNANNFTPEISVNDPPQGSGQLLSSDIHAISIKIPPFWTNYPYEWFLQVEAQFSNRNIVAQLTRYNYVLPALPQNVVAEITDVVRNPGLTPYDSIKNALISRFSKSNATALEELLAGAQIGDKKPSEFYRFMKTLADNANLSCDDLLSTLWLRRLPVLVQAAVKSSGKVEVDGMLSVADSVYEVLQQQQSQLSFTNTAIPSHPYISELVAQNSKLIAELASLRDTVSRLQGFRGRSRNRSRSRNNRSGSSSGNCNICWYHAKYGDAARTCKQPCTYKRGNGSGGNGQSNNTPN